MIQPSIPEEVRMLAEEAAGLIRERLSSDTRILWFGSWVLGTAVDRSDIDLAIDAQRALEPAESLELQESLERLPTLRSFDLVDLHGLSEGRRLQVLSEGIEL